MIARGTEHMTTSTLTYELTWSCLQFSSNEV